MEEGPVLTMVPGVAHSLVQSPTAKDQNRRMATRVSLPFPELPSDADTELPSWRTGLHSDWRLRLGPTVYRIHKVLTGHGPRASAFLCSAFTTGPQLAAGITKGGLEESCTELSNILPEQVWPVFGEVLDFVYNEELHLTDENAVPLLRCADALQIRSLFLVCVQGINDLLSIASAPRILTDTAALLGGALAEQIERAAQDVISENFDAFSGIELEKIPTPKLLQILTRDDLSILHENEVFKVVLDITSRLGADNSRSEAVKQLWQAVRLGALSNTCYIKAAQVDEIPRMDLIWAKVLYRKCGSSMLQAPNSMQSAESWPVQSADSPPRPRKLFKDLVCAVMYSVDTDARNDQDVERNITAATLVAEEIEFLGGRAILENIFARPPSARDTSEASIINMEQVDVAFVLAPWTPSEKRISRLINFVDQGGGAVLLSFIGGLSKGAWLDRQYEPLITGKAADNTPYEDVYLCRPTLLTLDLGDPYKRSNGTSLLPPRILCGVDSINGRRRITSKLVDGARVLAKWSDGQPLVVQHPDKNVFSISQRVSRIFELDDDLGHDDTLQLVLNVMAQAGKEARRLRGPRPTPQACDPDKTHTSSGAAGNGTERPVDPRSMNSLLMSDGGVNVSL